MSSSKKAT